MAKIKAKTKRVFKAVLGVLVTVLTLGAVVSIFSKCSAEDTKELNAFDYKVAVLDDATGKTVKDEKGGLVTKDMYLIDDLEIKLAKDADIKYQLNLYDEEKEWISVKTYTEDFDSSEIETLKATGARYVRIELIPEDDEDGEISLFEKSGYVKQATVTVSTETEVEKEEE